MSPVRSRSLVRLVAAAVFTALAVAPSPGSANATGTDMRVGRQSPAAHYRGLTYSTFLGGAADDRAHAVAPGPDGSTYVVGQAASDDLPTTTGVAQPNFGGNDGVRCESPCRDAFVGRYSSTGELLWLTYLGGSGSDAAMDVAVDASGYAYVTGYTMSIDFPLKNALQSAWNGGQYYGDAFVAKLSPDGASLVYSTYLGGHSGFGDAGFGIAVDSAGRATIAGHTESYDFPTTKGALKETCVQQAHFACEPNAFVSRLASDGSKLEWSTLFGAEPETGGSDGLDNAKSLAIASDGSVVIAGFTRASNFPATAGAFDRTFNGWAEGFVAKIAGDGSAVRWATYLGGEYIDELEDLVLDAQDRPMVVGRTESVGFPTTPNARDRFCNEDSADCHPYGEGFFTILAADGSALAYSTFLGGRQYDTATAIARDAGGNVWITGGTASVDFETKNPVQGSYAGLGCFWAPCYDAFVRQLLAGTWETGYSTYLGGFDADHGAAISVTGDAVAFAGYTVSEKFPVTNAADPTCGEPDAADCGQTNWDQLNGDAFVARLDIIDDADPPAGTITIAGGAAYARARTVTLDVPAADHGSGVSHVRLSNDGTTWSVRTYAPTQSWTLAAGDGPKVVRAQWRDGAGNWSGTRSDGIVLDATRPTTTAPTYAFVTGSLLSSGKPAIRVSWTGTDATSGVARYRLDMNTDGGSWVNVGTALTSPSLTLRVTPGHSYRFRVVATDRAGNVGQWVGTPSSAIRGHQQWSGSIAYSSGWQTLSSTAYWGGSLRYAAASGAQARFTFTGRTFAWVASTGSSWGSARVYVNGILAATVNLSSSAAASQRVVFARQWTTSATRTVVIRVVGTAGHPRVGIDGVLTGT